MNQLVKFIFATFIFWMLNFLFYRLFFAFYQFPIETKIDGASQFMHALVAGYQLDMAIACMSLLLTTLLVFLFYIFDTNWLRKPIWVWNLICIVIISAISISDAGLFREWNAKINSQALAHFKNPTEVFKTISATQIGLFVSLLSIFSISFYYIFNKKVLPFLSQSNVNHTFKKRLVAGFCGLVVFLFIEVLGIRGGLFGMPINQSVAFFSTNHFANQMAVNPTYNLIQDYSVTEAIPHAEQYQLTTNDEARRIISEDFLLNDNELPISILNTKRPNLIFIFLESWTSDHVGCLGGIADCTPNFDRMSKEGLLFTKAYSNAYVSDQGIPAVLSGYPSVSRVAIINQTSKIKNMPCISENLKPEGYSTGFMFGGELVYGNLKSYFHTKSFDDVKEVFDFKHPSGRLGIHDEYMFPELLKKLDESKEPFLQGFFTQSTHMPYDYTPSDSWSSESSNPEKAFAESMHYSDIHLGKFIDQLKSKPYYDNSLIVIVADHSHNSNKQWQPEFPRRHEIPLMLLGGALKSEFRGKKWEKMVSQLDIPKSILSQMGLSSEEYVWSRDIFKPSTPSSAYYVFYGGAGYINQQGYAASHLINLKNIISDAENDLLKNALNNKARSFQQLVYEDLRTRK